MAVGLKLSPQFLAGVFIVVINFYCVYDLLTKNKMLKERLALAKQEHASQQVLWQERLTSKLSRIKELDNQVMSSHSALGNLQNEHAKLKRDMETKSSHVEKLQKVASEHKNEIKSLQESLTNSKDQLSELTEKLNKLMTESSKERETLKMKNKHLSDQITKYEEDVVNLNKMVENSKQVNTQLQQQVSNLTHVNQVMREGIKKKIAESYKRQENYAENDSARARKGAVVGKATTKSVPDHKSTSSNSEMDQALSLNHTNREDNHSRLIRATNTDKTTTSIPNDDATTANPAELGHALPHDRLSRNIINPEDITNSHGDSRVPISDKTTTSIPNDDATIVNPPELGRVLPHDHLPRNIINPEDISDKHGHLHVANTDKTTPTSISNEDANITNPPELGHILPHDNLPRNIINPEDITNMHGDLHVANTDNDDKSTSHDALDEHPVPLRLRYGDDYKTDDQTEKEQIW